MSAHDAPSALARCENCGTVLQGGFCHVCGQHAHNPLRSFAHTAEEVFESFWHLDGRIFRTLADLFVPGRVAVNYLSGQRVRYLPPLRIFIILSVLTFFVGKLSLHTEANDTVDAAQTQRNNIKFDIGDDGKSDAIASARSADEVLRLREDALANVDRMHRESDAKWLVSAIGRFAEERIDQRAATRMRELGATPEQMRALERSTAQRQAAVASAAAPEPSLANAIDDDDGPGWLQDWLRERLIRMEGNIERIQRNPDEFVRLVLGAVPGALLILVPVFALCLKLLYLGSGRGYLEHLVVALYSHATMLLALLLTFVLVGAQSLAATPAWLDNGFAIAAGLVLTVAVPLYLLRMQKRVYAQGWPMTLTKFALIGSLYSVLLIFATIYAVLAGLSS